MPNTNAQTIHQMGSAINSVVRQATGRDAVGNIDMDFVTVAQNKTVIENTLSGEIVTFNSSQANPIPKISTLIEPIQNLNGYSYPWPEGGGVNKFNPAEAVNQRWINDGGDIQSVSGYWVTGYIPVKSGDVIRCREKGTVRNAFYDTNKENGVYTTYSGGSQGITAPFDGYVVMTVSGTLFPFGNNEFMITINTPASPSVPVPDYEPYSNICPITGKSSITIYHSGEDTEHPTEHTISFSPTPGTVYGGTLEMQNNIATLTVDHVLVNAKDISWDGMGTLLNGTGKYVYVQGVFNVSDTGRISNQYKASISEWNNLKFGEMNTNSLQLVLTVPPEITTIAAAEAYFEEHDTVILNKCTPITYTFNSDQITALVGENNLWSDTGNISVTYYEYGEVI